MKRIKIMLLSLFVLATVGGVLAFKAKEEKYCVYKKITTILPTTCPLLTLPFSVKVTNVGVDPIYTFVLKNGDCPAITPSANCSIRLTDFQFDN